MGSPLPRPAALNARLDTPVEEWPYLDEGTLCQATSKTEPLPTSKTEPPLAPEGRLFSESFRLGLAGG